MDKDTTITNLLNNKIYWAIVDTPRLWAISNCDLHKLKINVEKMNKDNIAGDYSLSFIMNFRISNESKNEFAQILIKKIKKFKLIKDAYFMNPGFINIILSDELKVKFIHFLYKKNNYNFHHKKNEYYNIEFLSANPTGLLHVGHARNAIYGNALTNIWRTYGINVNTEYYINDAGNQINLLALSVLIRYQQENNKNVKLPDDCYKGEEIIAAAQSLNKKIKTKYVDEIFNKQKIVNEPVNKYVKNFALNYMLDRIKNTLNSLEIKFDIWSCESSINNQVIVRNILAQLKPYTFIEDGALKLKTKNYGDDEDRVLIKANKDNTYFLPDICYHYFKFKRGYTKLFNIWGNDHIGYIPRLKIAMSLLGFNSDNLNVFLQQMVSITRKGVELKMSKRSGESLTIDYLVSLIGANNLKWWMLSTSFSSSHLSIEIDNIDDAKNPLYYVQYAYARINSILQKYTKSKKITKQFCDQTNHKLILAIIHYKSILEYCAKSYEIHQLCLYLYNLAKEFHVFYEKVDIYDVKTKESTIKTNMNIYLCKTVAHIIEHGLKILGIKANKDITKKS